MYPTTQTPVSETCMRFVAHCFPTNQPLLFSGCRLFEEVAPIAPRLGSFRGIRQNTQKLGDGRGLASSKVGSCVLLRL